MTAERDLGTVPFFCSVLILAALLFFAYYFFKMHFYFKYVSIFV